MVSIAHATGPMKDPSADFRRIFYALPATVPLIRWEADWDGDGRNEVILSDKENYDKERDADEAPAWVVYRGGESGFVRCDELQDGDSYLVNALIEINLDRMFIGLIPEAGNVRGVVTEQIFNPRVGDAVAVIKAYTLQNGRLKVTTVGEYNPMQPNALADKYFKDGKRTVVALLEVKPKLPDGSEKGEDGKNGDPPEKENAGKAGDGK